MPAPTDVPTNDRRENFPIAKTLSPYMTTNRSGRWCSFCRLTRFLTICTNRRDVSVEPTSGALQECDSWECLPTPATVQIRVQSFAGMNPVPD